MTDEQDHTLEPNQTPDDNVDNKLESLLPAPGDHPEDVAAHSSVDGKMDELLRAPGKQDHSADDASTREELEVDTSADGIDDFIPLHAPEVHDESANDEPRSEAEPAADTEAPEPKPPTPAPTTCLICGEEIGNARFCPECGTEQVPTSKIVSNLAPLSMWSRPLAIRVTLSIGAMIALLALLADSGTLALIISGSILPIVILIRLASQLGGVSRDSWIQVAMMMLVGTATGMAVALLATRIVRGAWFDGGVVNFGATSFGGIAVETVGNAPALVWLTSGILLPLVVILVIGAAPAALRMTLALRPNERTGMMLSAAVAAGFAIGSVVVFYWPLLSELPPIMSTSQWTLTILGVAIIRPLVWVYSGAILGAVVWRYLRDASLPGIAVPVAIAIGLPLVFSIASLAAAPAGLWVSSLLGLLFATAAVYLHTRFLATALSSDDAKLTANA